MLRANRADRLTVVAVVVVPVHAVRIKIDVPRVVRVVCVERRRPIVAVVADIVEVRVVAIPRCGETYKRQLPDTRAEKNHPRSQTAFASVSQRQNLHDELPMNPLKGYVISFVLFPIRKALFPQAFSALWEMRVFAA